MNILFLFWNFKVITKLFGNIDEENIESNISNGHRVKNDNFLSIKL